MRGRRLNSILLAIGLAVAGLLVAPGSTQAAPAPSPWLQTNYNAANSRANLAETTIGASNVTRLRRAYTITAPLPPACDCTAGSVSLPAISQSRLYVMVNDDLTAFDLTNGRRLWRTNVASDSYYGAIAVTHGYVLVGINQAHTSDSSGAIAVFAADTGAFVRYLPNPDYDAFAGLEVFGDKYIVAQYGCGECGGFGRTVVYRTSNLSVAWTTPLERVEINRGTGTSVVDGQTFEISQTPNTTDYVLRSYLAYNGAPRWTRSGIDEVLAGDTDAASANNLIVAGNGRVLDLNPRTGATRFALAGVSTNSPPIAVDATRIYAFCSSDRDTVCAFSTRDGTLLWKRTDPTGSYSQQLTVANGLVYLISGVVLSASTGAIVTTMSAQPVVVGSGHVGAYLGTPYSDRFAVLSPPAG